MAAVILSSWIRERKSATENSSRIDHFRNELFMTIVYGYESRSRHSDYLPRPVVGLLILLYSREYLFLPDCAMLLIEKAMNDYYKSLIQLHG